MKRKAIMVTIGLVAAALLVGVTSCKQAVVLTLSASTVEITVGESTEITATATDEMGVTDTINVASSDEDVATVEASGLTVTITGVSFGEATITVTSGSGSEATCDVSVGLQSTPEIEGNWLYLGGDYSSRLEIADGVIQFYSGNEAEIATTDNLFQECEITGVDNTQLNGGDEESTDCGYMVIKYTTPSVHLPNSQDKYGILRWADYNGSDTMWYSEGWIDLNSDDIGDHFDTPAEAIEGMTVDSGAFSAYPTMYSEAEKHDIEIAGTWHHDGGTYEEKWVITNGIYEKYSSFSAATPDYTFTIVGYNNDTFNAGESDSSDCGYAVMQYRDAPVWNDDADGYVVFRWKDLDTSGTPQCAISEGYNASYVDGASTQALALSEYTDANSCFTMYSSPCIKQ